MLKLSNDLQEIGIKNLLLRYELEPLHSRQVKKLAQLIFDKTKGLLHNMNDEDRQLLTAGALLHDIGYYISAKDHHKNSYKLIMQDKIEGFSGKDLKIIANIARYHRGRLPNKKHEAYMILSEKDRKTVNKLSAIVRLADALDSTHCNVVDDLDFTFNAASGVLFVLLKLNSSSYYFEMCKAQDKKDFFEKEYCLEVQFGL